MQPSKIRTAMMTLSRQQRQHAVRKRSYLLNKPRVMSTLANDDVDKLVLKPWPRAMVESHGDYRAEAFLEKHIGGPLYAQQTSLPKLPIPPVSQTIEKFLPTALPLAETQGERESLLEACRVFEEQSQTLQQRLHNRRDGEMKDSSWLQHWWNTLGYLQVRDPVTINVSYFFHFTNDGTLPSDKPRNVTRGASLLYATAEFRNLVASGQWPCDTVGRNKTPLCSVAYKYMFHACRIPKPNQDVYHIHDPSLHSHAIVARKGFFFAIELFDSETATKPLPVHVLEDQLEQVIKEADTLSSSHPELGWLTSSNRDDWARAREELIRVGGTEMEQALERLESGAILLCLDDEEPISRKECGQIFWHGTPKEGRNRWFDKSIQLFCTNNGVAGLQGEHSMMDGMPVVNYADHLTRTGYALAKQKSAASRATSAHVQHVFENVSLEDPTVRGLSDNAKEHFVKLVTDHAMDVQSFHGYGSNFIKKSGFSPDAFVQVAIQVATFRLFEKQVATYEATQMRPFYHGRTETTRAVSTESHAFCQAMGLVRKYDEHDAGSRKHKLALLQDAVNAHVKYIGAAAKGDGVDRHFFGLSMLVQDGEQAPSLYSNPVFARSKHWRVSTSHLTHPKFENWGYGEVVPDGVGLSYAIKADGCVFTVTALKEHGWTDKLSHLLEDTLLEMRDLLQAEEPPRSKL